MKPKKDPAEDDGLATLADGPAEALDVPGAAQPAAPDPAQRQASAAADEIEDQPTEQWASAASQLFAGQAPPAQQPDEDWTDLDGTDFDAHLSALSAPLPREGDTLIDTAVVAKAVPEPPAARVSLKIEPEEMNTDLDATLSDALQSDDDDDDDDDDDESDTVEMTPEEAAAAISSAKASLDIAMRRQSAGQGAAAQPQPVPGGEQSALGQPTVMVSRPGEADRLTQQCRLCGRSISRPKPVHFRGSPSSNRGLRCEKCHNIVCAAHATRVSGFWESLFKQGRFCCALCLPAAQSSDPRSS